MEEELSLDNILGTEEIENLFVEEEVQDTPPEEKGDNNTKEKDDTTEVNVDTLFTDKPESVGSEDDIEEKEDAPDKGNSTSPETFYSSIANALKEEGVFPDLDEESLSKVKDSEDFRDLIEQQIKAGLDEKQRRIDEALSVGVEPSEIKQYENVIEYLDSIGEDSISEENDQGEKLRKELIYHDFINRGYSKERAEREVNKSFNAGTDIEDAKEALKSNLEFFKDKYKNLVNEAKADVEREKETRKKQAENLKSSILDAKDVFGVSVDKAMRQKIYDNIAKPTYRDPETGEYLTAIQKYEKENKIDFLKNISVLYTLTDGFKNLDGLTNTKVKKEVKKGLKELERVISNTSRTSDGNIRFVSNVNDDPESFIGKGWTVDI